MKRVILSGDWHVGAGTVDVSEVKSIVRHYFRGHPVVLLGDFGNIGIDRGMEFADKLKPQEQIDRLYEITANLDVRAWCIGNHDVRIFKKVGLNPFIRMFGKKPTNDVDIGGRHIFFNHGKSAAENTFLEHSKYARWVKGDVIALGHSHTLARMIVLRNKRITHYVRTGSFLGNEKYAVEAGYCPQMKGWAEYDTEENIIYLKAIYNGEVIDI